MLKTIKKLFGMKELDIDAFQGTIQEINSLEGEYETYSDEGLKNKILEFKSIIAESDEEIDIESQKELLVHVFAITREASKRVFGLRHYDVQLLGGICLNEGCIAEMQTGEGKTLVATCPAVFNAVMGNRVHIITVNDYLATRDFSKMGELYAFLGLSTGLVVADMLPQQKKMSYECDIVYGTNSEFGFDYLRDNMLGEDKEPVQKALDFVIIDEVDSVLIDEARTPLIISSQAEDRSEMYIKMAEVVKDMEEGVDFYRDKIDKKLLIDTDEGIRKVEEAFGVQNLYSAEHTKLLNAFSQSLKAHFIFEKDRDYVVKNGEVVIVDSFTGRVMEGRRYSDGLHQAIEAKEGVELKKESKTVATVTYQNFFRLYKKISGMTGTAKTEEKEFYEIYGMPVLTIPKNKPPRRVDYPDLIFKTKQAKLSAVVEKVKECYSTGQPFLVGTTSIATSEEISSMLEEEEIPHQVLNAKHDAEEASIISQAGRIGAVTIATNMAGRGTDIMPEDGVDELGGIFVLGTEKHESRRIDNQLKGRTARQGANGETQFFISLEDDLFKYFGGEKLLAFFDTLKIDLDDAPIESERLTKSIEKSQQQIESKNFDIRKHLLEYDDVLNTQRNIMYKQRAEIKASDYYYIRDNLNNFIEIVARGKCLDVYASPEDYPEDWNLEGLIASIQAFFGIKDICTVEEIQDLEKPDLDDVIIYRLISILDFKEQVLGRDVLTSILKTAMLNITDSFWTSEINDMTALKEGINLRAYGQLNPLYEYKKEALLIFQEMEENIKEQFVRFAIGFTIQFNNEEGKNEPSPSMMVRKVPTASAKKEHKPTPPPVSDENRVSAPQPTPAPQPSIPEKKEEPNPQPVRVYKPSSVEEIEEIEDILPTSHPAYSASQDIVLRIAMDNLAKGLIAMAETEGCLPSIRESEKVG